MSDSTESKPINTRGLTASPLRPAASMPTVQGRCPACGGSTLFLASGGYVTCAYLQCSNPTLAADVLTSNAQQMIVKYDIKDPEPIVAKEATLYREARIRSVSMFIQDAQGKRVLTMPGSHGMVTMEMRDWTDEEANA